MLIYQSLIATVHFPGLDLKKTGFITDLLVIILIDMGSRGITA